MLCDDVLVLIPTLNEERAIGYVIDGVLSYAPGSKIVVIDGSSMDGTAEKARRHGAEVVDADAPKGKGKAVRTMLPGVLASHVNCKYVVMLDGDYTYPARHIPEMVKELEDGAGVVIGYRKFRDAGSMTRTNRLGNIALSLLASLLYNVWVWDLCSGMWGFRSHVLNKYAIESDKFTLEADLFRSTVRGGWKLSQIPISYRGRLGGSMAKLRVRDGLEIGWFLIKKRLG